MFCTATLGGQIIKIIYEKDNILIFTIRNIKGNKYEYYNIIVNDPAFINLIKRNVYKSSTIFFISKFNLLCQFRQCFCARKKCL